MWPLRARARRRSSPCPQPSPTRILPFSTTPHRSQGRFLSEEYYVEAAEGFSDYDPGVWMPTLQARMTPFMFYPWLLITVLVTLLTWYVEAHKGVLDEFSLSTDAHIVMGGGTPTATTTAHCCLLSRPPPPAPAVCQPHTPNTCARTSAVGSSLVHRRLSHQLVVRSLVGGALLVAAGRH